MKTNQNKYRHLCTVATVLCLSFFFSSCELVEGIFKAGMGFGIFIVLAVAVAVVAIIIKVGKNK
ncbi:hypothetical protein [Flavobacterium terrisoli]|uniref:hypothetical protein n=1 Tax=Flavobacterium terrisoli TaxID=3242195 RepID=UPI002542E884|nr:hypothetical protein [Flavobacterium buctense]